jgi:hypothetical protein
LLQSVVMTSCGEKLLFSSQFLVVDLQALLC